jgi:hypothetical protein
MDNFKSTWSYSRYLEIAAAHGSQSAADRHLVETSLKLILRSKALLARCSGDYTPLLPK